MNGCCWLGAVCWCRHFLVATATALSYNPTKATAHIGLSANFFRPDTELMPLKTKAMNRRSN